MATTAHRPIDADGHIRDDEQLLRKYLEPPFDRRGVIAAGAARDGFDNTMDLTLGTRTVNASVWLDALDRGNLESTVLYPTGGLSAGWLREPDFAVARCRAYNNLLSEEYLKVSPRFKGVALMAVQDPVEAAKELRRCVTELGMVGGTFPEGPHPLGKREYDPVYEEAERLGVPIAIHAGGRLTGSMDEFLFDRLIQVHSLGHAFTQMKQFVSIMFEGVPERYPKLKLAY